MRASLSRSCAAIWVALLLLMGAAIPAEVLAQPASTAPEARTADDEFSRQLGELKGTFADLSKKFDESAQSIDRLSTAEGARKEIEDLRRMSAIPPSPQVALYLDTVKLDPLRNGNALLRHRVGVSKLQTEGEGGYLAVLCSIDVKKNRITSVTVSATSRAPRCQCARTGGTDATGSRTCIG